MDEQGPHRWRRGQEAARDTTRIEAFSDAVIAIMLTLLAVELLKFDPAMARRLGLLRALGQGWSSYCAFALTFLVVGQIWITHHNLWRYIARVDQGISILNLLLLVFVAVTPFAAQVLANGLLDLSGPSKGLAGAFYSAVMLGQALAFNLILWWARRQDLLYDEVDESLFRAMARRYLFGPAIYATAFAVSFVSPIAGLACYIGVVLLYFLPGAGDLPPGRQQAPEAP